MSAPEIVNPVPVEHVEPWLRQLASTLLGDPYDSDFPRRVQRRLRNWDAQRTWGVRDRGRWVATLATDARTLTVPGPGTTTRDLSVDALTAVSVSATHRRRGLLSDMLGRSLAAAKERGDAVSMLIAAEWPIYGRFGYAPATSLAHHHYDPRRSGLAVEADHTRIRQVEPDEAGPIANEVFDLARRRRAGQLDRHAPWWDRQVGLDGYEHLSADAAHWYVHDGPDGPDGVLAWMSNGSADLQQLGKVTVSQFVAATEASERDLWGYLAGLDLVDDIDFWGPVDEPARFLLRDGRALRQTELIDFLWVRLLDVPVSLAARSYAGDGEVVLEVRDSTPGNYAQARVQLTVADGEATCVPTERAPDVRLDQRTLASMYLGGFRLQALAPAQSVEELTPGALGCLDLMFSTPLAPYTQTSF